jgi:hypothetical protein
VLNIALVCIIPVYTYIQCTTGAVLAVPAAEGERVILMLRKLKPDVRQRLKPRPLLVDTPLSNLPTAIVLDNSSSSDSATSSYRVTPAIETEHVRAVYDTIATHW